VNNTNLHPISHRFPGTAYAVAVKLSGALKMQDVKMTDQVARHEIAGHENAQHENDGPSIARHEIATETK